MTMFKDFTFSNPTVIHFGRNSLDCLKEEVKKYGNNILLAYGKASIKKIGLYDKIVTILKEAGKTVYDFEGIMPNPTLEKMLLGAKMVREHNIDLILAVGGGSVIDCAKAISVSAYCEEDPFEKYWIRCEEVSNKIVPVASILTMCGTGSEMNGGSVITDTSRKIKKGHVFQPSVYPKFSILNPEFTYSVSEYQMVSGIFDAFSHLMEQYFSDKGDSVTDYISEGLMRSLVVNCPKALVNREDYEARSNIMWASCVALNTLEGVDKSADWIVHSIEHQISAFTDCAHGMGLAAISVPIYRKAMKGYLPKFVRFATEVFKVDPTGLNDEEIASKGLDCLAQFIKDNKMCTSLRELGVTKDMLKDIAYSSDTGSCYIEFDHEDILEVLKAAY